MANAGPYGGVHPTNMVPVGVGETPSQGDVPGATPLYGHIEVNVRKICYPLRDRA